MVLVSFSYRIIVDCEFVRWMSGLQNKSMVISKMLRINQNSLEHKKENILIMGKDFADLCSDGTIKDKDTIRGGICPFDNNKELGISDGKLSTEATRLLTGVILARQKPFRTILLTTKEGKKTYLSNYNKFLEKIQNFSIAEEEDAVVIINDLFNSYCSQKDLSRL